MELKYFRTHVIETLGIYALSTLIASGISYSIPKFINCSLLYFVGGILFITPFVVNIIMKLRSRERLSPAGKAVFISGCDTGFGHMLAQRMDDLGFQVFAGCLYPNGEGAKKLSSSGSSRMHVIGVDVTSDYNVREAAKYVDENLKDNELWAVVNNSGLYDVAYLHWANIQTAQRLFEVNAMGLIRVTQAFLPKLIPSKGRVVTVASLTRRCLLSGHVPYAMTKCAAAGFSDSLRIEMLKWGVNVVTIDPWLHRTPMMRESAIREMFKKNWEAAPKDVKDVYNTNYIEKYTEDIIRLMKLTFSDYG